MPELNDQETDKLFQTGAERHDYTYNPDAWELMETMLDADRRRSVLWYQVAGILVLLALIALSLFYYSGVSDAQVKGKTQPFGENFSEILVPGVTPGRDSDGVVAAKASDSAALAEGVVGSSSVIEESEAKAEMTKDNPVRFQTPDISIVDKQPTSGVGSAEAKQYLAVSENNPTEENSIVGKGDEQGTNDLERPEAADFSKTENDRLQGEGRRNTPLVSNIVSPDDRVELLPHLPLPQQVLSDGNRLSPLARAMGTVDVAVTADVQSVPQEDTEVRNSLAVGVAAGVILGRSGADPFAMAQPRLGLDVEYRFGKKFAVSTGAYFNQVCYRTSGENYTAKSDFWTDGIKPEVVQGECNVLELPLSASYYFNGSRKNSFYVSGGTISYLMLKEDYAYEYDASAPADARKGWKEKNNNQHFMGMAHFNFGFQKTIGKNSALKLESYVHLPLTGVGHGEVRLFSAGMTAKYLFDFRK